MIFSISKERRRQDILPFLEDMIKSITLDIETYSSVDLKKSGVYVYAESPDFEILLLSYSIDGGTVQTVDLANGETVPDEIIKAFDDPAVIKHAFNANFERVCLSFWLHKDTKSIEDEDFFLDPAGWHCDMVWAAYLSLPMSLEKAGAVLNLDQQKMKEGKELIRFFSMPCRPSKSNGYRTRNLPADHPVKWQIYKTYNQRDVETELAIQQKLAAFPVPDFLWDEYALDQQINDRGVLIDMELVENALQIDAMTRKELLESLSEKTGLENPNSVTQLKTWLSSKGIEVQSLGKKDVEKLLEETPEEIREILKLRLEISKSSIRKYEAMKNGVNSDNRARGLFKFYGANRTGRFAGSRIQLQNLKRNSIPDLDAARLLVKSMDVDALKLLYDSIPELLSQLIRTALIPKEGSRFVVADFSAIEARVLSWLAGEKWRMDTFATGGDIYCATASRMFHCNVVKHGENGELRQKGKQAELACIAKGSLVDTPYGKCRIENLRYTEKVWDGQIWVSHEGVIYKGRKTVIHYGGLCATPDHLVYPDGFKEPMPLMVAAMLQIPLTETQNDFSITWGQADTYDVLNAGDRHRFMVSDVLVHNCGYGGSVGAMKAMGALDMGMKEEELKPLVDSWREANPNIVVLWWKVDQTIKDVLTDKKPRKIGCLEFFWIMNLLFIRLPSMRGLVYAQPKITDNQYDSESVIYMGVGPSKKWEAVESYGPKFVENIVQAISRDLLMESMKRLCDYRIVGHIHDEVIIETELEDPEYICREMSLLPAWAKGLVLNADGYCCDFYRKD